MAELDLEVGGLVSPLVKHLHLLDCCLQPNDAWHPIRDLAHHLPPLLRLYCHYHCQNTNNRPALSPTRFSIKSTKSANSSNRNSHHSPPDQTRIRTTTTEHFPNATSKLCTTSTNSRPFSATHTKSSYPASHSPSLSTRDPPISVAFP